MSIQNKHSSNLNSNTLHLLVEFTKNLSPSEAKYKYLGLPKKIRTEFPPKDEIFQVEFKTRSYKMKVNNKNSIMISQLYDAHQFRESDLLKIVKNDITSFSFSVER